MSLTLTESERRKKVPTYVMAWLGTRKRTPDATGDLVEILKPKARHLLPGHFPNATVMYKYAAQLGATREMLDEVGGLYLEYRKAYHDMRHGEGTTLLHGITGVTTR